MRNPTIFVDGMLSGTGIRDAVNGGYIKPEDLGLSGEVRKQLSAWLSEYANAHFFDFKDAEKVKSLDEEGIRIAKEVQTQVKDASVGYYSSATLRELQFR